MRYESFKKKTILIVGAGGYIGSKLVSILKDADCVIYRQSRKIANLQPHVNSTASIIDIECDLVNIKENMNLSDVDMIFWLSWQTSIYIAESDPIDDFKNNIIPLITILEEIKNINKIIDIAFASSATVFKITKSLPVNDNFTENPITVYDLHKIIAEKYLKYYADQNCIRYFSLRLANVFGDGNLPKNNDRGILNKMILKAVNEGKVTIYGDGNYIRDYIHIEDVVEAFLLGMGKIESIANKNYLISSGIAMSIKNAFTLISSKVEKMTFKNVLIQFVDEPSALNKIEKRNFVGDSSLFSEQTGWKQKISFEEGIMQNIQKLIGNRE